MSNRAWIKALFLILVVVGSATGCGDNVFEGLTDGGGTAGKIESARIALDSRDYTSAITILEGLCGTDISNPTCDAETRTLLASAYSGRAGLDVINLISKASAGSFTSFGTFSTLLPNPTDNSKSDIGNAVTLLSGIATRTAAQSLQMAVVATADIVITLGVDVTNGFNTSTGDPSMVPSSASQIPQTTADQVTSDVFLIGQGISESGLVNKDLTNDINTIKSQLDSNSNGTVTTSELQSFLASL
jgi:hypothetical protein